MLIYFSGKILQSFGSQIVLKLPNGQGFLINVNPAVRYSVNETLELYLFDYNGEMFGFETFEERLLIDKLIRGGLETDSAIETVYRVGVDKVQKAIINKDDSQLRKVEGLSVKNIGKILEIEATQLLFNGKPESSEMHKESYSASEFTDKMQTLGYNRNQIVGVISTLKQESKWGQVNLIELVKFAIEYLETTGKR